MGCFATASVSVKETARRPGREKPRKFTQANYFKGWLRFCATFERSFSAGGATAPFRQPKRNVSLPEP
jgi:hypothetical protein